MNRTATLQYMREKAGEPTVYRFVAATSGRKADGVDLVIDESAVDLSRFQANPIILSGHDYSKLPIGRATKITVEPGRLLLDVIFDEASAAGKEIARMVRDKFLNAMSIGFEVLKTAAGRATRWRLLEASVVGLPLDADALIQRSYRSSTVPPASVVIGEQTPQEAVVQLLVAERDSHAARLAGLRADLNRLELRRSLEQLQSQLRRTR